MIYTSSYNNWKSDKFKTFSISFDRGKDAKYEGDCYLKLAPNLSFWRIWKSNRGIISEEENNKYYIYEYWQQILSKLNPEEVYQELNNSTLLCYEPNTEFCHRHIVAAWFELFLGVTIKEKIANEYQTENVPKPKYIKEYLEEIIKQNINLRGFNSLRALYLFEKAEKLERLADELEIKTGNSYDHYREEACFLRHDAKIVEEEYALPLNFKKLKKEKLVKHT